MVPLDNKFCLSPFLVVHYVFGVADADFDVNFCIVLTVLKIFADE